MDDLPECDELIEYMLDDGRFYHASDVELFNARLKSYSKKTLNTISTVEKIFFDWVNVSNNRGKTWEIKPIEEYSDEVVNEMMCLFIIEVRNSKGETYKADTLKLMVYTIQMMLARKGRMIKFTSEEKFINVNNTFENRILELTIEGKGHSSRSGATVIERKHEIQLWENGIFNAGDLHSLLNTLVYHLGLSLALRTGEHRNLRFANFDWNSYEDKILYTELSSKTNNGLKRGMEKKGMLK